MSTNMAPSLRATDSPGSAPSEADVAKARFEEAKAITDALVVRLSRERSELAGTRDEGRVRVLRRVEVTRIELVDARAYEARVFRVWERERSLLVGRPVAGVRSDQSAPRGHEPVSIVSGAFERPLRPSLVGGNHTGRRSARVPD